MARGRRSHGQGTLFKRAPRGPWIGRWFDHNGKRREVSTRTTDRATAERILVKKVADAALRRDGVIDSSKDRYAVEGRRPWSEHVAEFHAYLLNKGAAEKTANLVRTRVKKILELACVQTIVELTPTIVQRLIGEMGRQGVSLQTCQHYLRAIKQFYRWLMQNGRAATDVLAHLRGFNVATDRRYNRRALSDAEIGRLIEAAGRGPVVMGMSGEDRAMVYRVALGTGFRVAELRSLTTGSFDLDVEPPTVTVTAGYSKRRRDDLQPIRADLAERLSRG